MTDSRRQCPNDRCYSRVFQCRVEGIQTGYVSSTASGRLEFTSDELPTLHPAEAEDSTDAGADAGGHVVVECRGCHDVFLLTGGEFEPTGKPSANEEPTVDVAVRDLETVLEFLLDDPALDSAPDESEVPEALQSLEEAVDIPRPRYTDRRR